MHAHHPSTKLTADNAAKLELSSHRRVVASASAHRRSSTSCMLSSADLDPRPSPDSDTVDNSPMPPLSTPWPSDHTWTSSKWPRASHAGVNAPPSASTLISEDNEALTGLSTLKKAKKSARPAGKTVADVLEAHLDVEIMNIDNVDDPREESLNKTDATADIKACFTVLASAPGEEKTCVTCDWCA
jgi:hypothetical protein